jgi:PucR C-terminal helix-turn-helix domain/GGDEF-like domain
MPVSPADQIREWSARFRKDALAQRVVIGLQAQSDRIWENAFRLMQRESPEYRNSVDEEFTRESKSHCNELLKMIVGIAAGRTRRPVGDPFDFVRGHAAWRARHRVPLTASLHAYRLAHRIYWNFTRDALLDSSPREDALRSLTTLSDFWIEFFDQTGAVLAEAHAVEETLMAGQSSRADSRVMNDLLRGFPPSEAEAQRLCALCGIRADAMLAVAVARPLPATNGRLMDLDAALRSLVRLIDQVLPRAGFGRLIEIREGAVTALVCSDNHPSRELVDAMRHSGLTRRGTVGTPALVGISRDAAEIAGLPVALEEAQLAAQFAAPSRPVLHFPDVDLPEFLLRRAAPAAFRLIPEWARQFASLGDGQPRELLHTIRAFAECNFNVKQTAKRLDVHTNTVYFRLNRIKGLTGIDPRTYSGTNRLLTALRLVEIESKDGMAAKHSPGTAS